MALLSRVSARALIVVYQFFSSSLTWSRALNIPLYICAADKEWYSRIGDLKDSDDVRLWSGETELGPGVKLVQCGG